MNVPATALEFDLREAGPPSLVGNAPLPDYPFEQNLQQKQLGVAEFGQVLAYFLNNMAGSLTAAYHAVRMGLAGRIPCETEGDEPAKDDEAPEEDDNTVFSQIRIDTLMDRDLAPYDDMDVLISGDVDSILAFSSNLGTTHEINIAPFPDYSRTLKTDIHHSILIGNDYVSVHRIPNFCLGGWGLRGQINVFLPRLYNKDVLDRRISTELQEYIYNEIIRPAQEQTLQSHHTHLHTTYRSAFANQRDRNSGRIHRTSTDIPGHLVQFFGEAFYRLANDSPHHELHDPIFMMQQRGTKALYSFMLADAEERNAAIQEVRALFTDVMFEEGQATILVDLATEISIPGHVLRMKRESHPGVLRWTIPGLTGARANGITALRSYYLDPSAQLYDLCGSRWAPQIGVLDYHGLRYFQMYFTDKTFSYSLDFSNMFSTRLAVCTLPTSIQKLSDQLADICNQIADLKDHPASDFGNRETLQDGAVRIEVRINIKDVDNYMNELPIETVRSWIVPYPSPVWWTFIYGRVRAIKVVVDMLLQAQLVKRGMQGALQLSAALVVMLNAIFSRESTKAQDRTLLEASGRRRRTPEENTEDLAEATEYVGQESGLYFLSDIILGGDNVAAQDRVPRLPNASADTFGTAALASLFREKHFRDLLKHFDPLAATAAVNPMRTNNRRNMRDRDVEDVQAALPEPPRAGIIVPTRVRFRAPPRLNEVDPGFHPNIVAQEETRETTGYVDAETAVPADELERIVRQFVLDIFAKAPNKTHGGASYVLLNEEARDAVTIEDLRTLKVSRFVGAAYILVASAAQWDTCFDHAFPAPGAFTPSSIQNYKSVKYWSDWKALMDQLAEHGPTCRTAIRKVFDTFVWIPPFLSDRIWKTKNTAPRGYQRYPADAEGTIPWIVINPRFKAQARTDGFGF